ncbi:hypothetical protein MTsPCn9_06370 [Croceitalea sp. MTPC9]|uniref:hypothetical protein n=1 Tax=unclassified Croceitalea TaxID=2632280 RepID=UPI002B37D021|nr:hypothetical protein MTsPCn6_02340 [Croceitalea sp. MTPC6]GMN15701.1 hypothetical protein MTsPCn9_06370 [Croceitalea sp. MTPC9]
MYLTYPSLNKLIYGVLFLVFFCHETTAQENLHYKGPLTVGKYKGDADYGYKLIEGDTVLNGSFNLKKANLDSLLKKQDYSFDFAGNFQNNYPTGYWKFQFGEFQSNNQSQVIDYQYRVAINGVQEKTSGKIVKGKPNGSWTYTVSKIEDSKVSQTLFKSSIDFNNGVPQKSFRVENDSLILAGRFLRNGLAHDEWSLYDSFGTGASENWIFSNGLLNQIQTEIDGDSKNETIYGTFSGTTKTINLDEKYIKAIAIYQFANSGFDNTVGGKMQQLLAQNAAYYKKIDDILSELGESSFLPEFKVKVPYFQLTEEEQQQLVLISENYEAANAISTSFLADTQLNILKLSDNNAAFQYEIIKKIAEDFLKPIGKLLGYNDQDIIEFAPRQQLIQKLWSSGKPSATIDVVIVSDTTNNTNRSFSLDTKEEFDFSNNDLGSLVQLSLYARESLSSIKNKLEERLTNEKRQQELVSIEEKLIAKQKELHIRIDSSANNSPSSIKKALNILKEHSDEALSSYSSLSKIESKLIKAKELSSCYDQLNVLAENIIKLPEQEETIKIKYQDRIWNPFMATLMDEEVKKRITSAYRKVLVPYFLTHAQEEFKCKDAKALNVLMKDTYQRMLELRVENTSKLERKLRKETDPLKVIALFGLQPIKKEQ